MFDCLNRKAFFVNVSSVRRDPRFQDNNQPAAGGVQRQDSNQREYISLSVYCNRVRRGIASIEGDAFKRLNVHLHLCTCRLWQGEVT